MENTWRERGPDAGVMHSSNGKMKTLPRGGGSGPHACRTCAAAKVRCLPGGNGETRCQRCIRLQKDCVLQPTKERKKRSLGPRKTRVAVLEKKIDDIVTLLKASNEDTQDQNDRTDTSNTSASSPRDLPHSNISTLFLKRTPTAIYSEDAPNSHIPSPALQEPSNESSSTQGLPIQRSPDDSQSEPSSWTRKDACLNVYRSSMEIYFPFILVPLHMSAKELSETKPFLARTIFSVAHYKESGPHTERGKDLLRHLSERLLLEGEKTLDLLQGMLVYITWYRSFFYSGRQITTLFQMANSLLIDLGLNAPVRQDRYRTVQDVVSTLLQGVVNVPQQTLEEKRAFLGCFFMSSLLSYSSSGMEPIPYTPYVKECCEALIEAAEYPTDALAVEMIHIQSVMTCVRQAIPQGPVDLEKTHTLINFHINSAQQQLESLRKSWPTDKTLQEILLINYHYAEMVLYEIPVFLILNAPNFNPSFWKPDLKHDTIDYLSRLGACTSAVLDAFFAIQPKGYFHITTMLWKPFGRASIVLRKLAFLKEVPGWDYKKARERFDLPKVLDKVVSNAIEASKISSRAYPAAATPAPLPAEQPDEGKNVEALQNQNDMLLELASRMRRLKAGYIEAVRLDDAGLSVENMASVLVLPRSTDLAQLQNKQPQTQNADQQQSQQQPSALNGAGWQLQQSLQGTDMWSTEAGETLLAMDDDFWFGFWQDWQLHGD
ncbi:hypothetical protein BGW36DRAFT_386105 [Talaromyces proteolyticus]|uniref:Zn(2)-C6 fungal-type domain-containing protein n=1 Tax=Talaromyces proteolyticus TaxID=1131652 RepID=A0AAD4KQH3_9EURO|nr:uncharacterized protein BGW36DRAFT_386105 [Talaromyces proteolyticus]KAH8693189.1 hypothetical protein BGW36DRAFT_386105 [Talaromyces proteolyticus]